MASTFGYQYRHEIGRDNDRGCVGQKAREQRNQEPEISSGPQLAPDSLAKVVSEFMMYEPVAVRTHEIMFADTIESSR